MTGPVRRLGIVVAFVTMGCAKNEVDSAHMADRLSRAGYDVTDDLEQADVIIVNTCSFIQAATEESIDAVLEASQLPKINSGKGKLVVSGCMPARYKDDLASEFPEVNAFVQCSQESQIVEKIDLVCGVERMGGEIFATGDYRPEAQVCAYVKISDGCNRFCSYCTIPFIRGRYHSFAFEDIENEVSEKIASGAREIVLIAQDTGRWGDDFDEPKDLAWLLEELARRHEDTWFRVMYIQPEGITDGLIEAVARHDNICSYFDIPFQHVNAQILKTMNRKGDAASFLGLIERIRNRIPEVTLRTTLIAGYPGETDEQFEELCEFVEEASLDYVGVFGYSREEGTRAYDLPDQVEEDVKLERTQQLRDLADDVSSAVIASRIGKTSHVLVCGYEEDGQLFGRATSQAPEVDGVTYLDSGKVGTFVAIRIEDTLLYEMEGTVLD